MSNPKIILVAMAGWSILTANSLAQDTNVYPQLPPTILETLEQSTGILLVKSTAPVGSLSEGGTIISVTCKENVIVGTNQKEYGIMVGIKLEGEQEDRAVVDYEELDPLLNAIEYLSKIDWSVTSLTSFSAGFTTKAGFRVGAFSSKRSGQIEFTVRGPQMARGFLLPSHKFAELHSLLKQARKKLNEIQSK